jgi:hypothetical protein
MASDKLRKKLEKRRKQLDERGKGFGFFIFKDEGIRRMRVTPVGDDQDWAVEATVFYLGPVLKGYISPATFNEKCPIMALYNKLSQSDSDKDKKFAESFKPRKKFFVPMLSFKDIKGEEIDAEAGVKLAQLAHSQYKQALDFYLDPEQGDFTDPLKGYDLKFKRTGKGQMDTEYSVTPCKPTRLDKKYRGPYNPEEMVKKLIPTYEAALDIKKQFVGDRPSSSKSSKKKKSK